jgi:hypothetical protein
MLLMCVEAELNCQQASSAARNHVAAGFGSEAQASLTLDWRRRQMKPPFCGCGGVIMVFDNGNARAGDHCEVVGGTHKGKSGTVRDVKLSKTGHVTITVVQDNGERFKTLARNVQVRVNEPR